MRGFGWVVIPTNENSPMCLTTFPTWFSAASNPDAAARLVPSTRLQPSMAFHMDETSQIREVVSVGRRRLKIPGMRNACVGTPQPRTHQMGHKQFLEFAPE